jgi:hypothetical protein
MKKQTQKQEKTQDEAKLAAIREAAAVKLDGLKAYERKPFSLLR